MHAVTTSSDRPAGAASVTRRKFLRRTAPVVFATFAAPVIVPASALGAAGGRPAASGRIALGVIGAGNQGMNDLQEFLRDDRVQIVAVCDVNRESPGYWDGKVAGREPARCLIEAHYAKAASGGTYRGCATLDDFRALIARADIDAVLIALPDHWHALPVILAAAARKHIYGQKPLSLTVAEGRAMVEAVRRSGVVFQCGSQQRSDAHFRWACEMVRNGRVGKLHTVRCGLPGGRPDYGRTGQRKKPEPIPSGFNYDFWLGPAPWAPYAPARCHVNFRWIYDYSGGQVTDWGGHHPDIAQWGMNTERTGPIEIRNPKAVFPADELWNTATEFYFEAIYANGVRLIISDKAKGGVTFEGTLGTIWAHRGVHDAEPKSLLDEELAPNEIHLPRSDNHYRNFIDCILARREPVAPCEVAHRSITICHLGNIALRLGRNLRWDPAKERILGDESASAMLRREYRKPWAIPRDLS